MRLMLKEDWVKILDDGMYSIVTLATSMHF